MKRENNFELVRERVLERAADAAGDASAAAFDRLVEEKLKPNFDVFALASEAAEADRGCTGMPRSVTRAAFLHALCAKLDLSAEGFEKKLLQDIVLFSVKAKDIKDSDATGEIAVDLEVEDGEVVSDEDDDDDGHGGGGGEKVAERQVQARIRQSSFDTDFLHV